MIPHPTRALAVRVPSNVRLCGALALLLTCAGGAVARCETVLAPVLNNTPAPVRDLAPAPERDGRTATAPTPTPVRIVVVHWKIKPGREREFLEYWSQRSVVADRSGLVGEFLNSVEDQAHFPWINMQSVRGNYTSYFNVGIWRDEGAFEDQIGKFINNARPPLPFEAARRERVFLEPQRWRIGGTPLGLPDRPDVK